jgi:hypothetical protein
MRCDRPFIGSVLLLASGLALLFGYCHGTVSMSAAYPLDGSTFNMSVTTTGPAVLGGVVLTALGLLAMLWALVAAIVSQVQLIGSTPERVELPKRVSRPEVPQS